MWDWNCLNSLILWFATQGLIFIYSIFGKPQFSLELATNDGLFLRWRHGNVNNGEFGSLGDHFRVINGQDIFELAIVDILILIA